MLKGAENITRNERTLVESTGFLVKGFRNYSNKNLGIAAFNPMERLDDSRIAPVVRAKAALAMTNFIQRTTAGTLNETSRADLPGWVKTGLGLIAATYAESLLDKVISIQPMPTKSARLHYMDIQTESAKGDLPPGSRIFDALRGHSGKDDFASEKVTNEPTGAAGSTNYTEIAEYRPIIPRSVHITDGVQNVHDDGNGNLVGDIASATNTFNYITGAYNVTFASATTGPVVVSYTYNVEAALLLPKYGISLRSIQVEARPLAIATEWSQQSVFDFMNDYGVEVEPAIMDAGAKIIDAEKFKHIVNHLLKVSSGGTIVFDNRTPTGISYRQHIDSFGILVSRLQNEIWQHTQRVRPNVLIHSPDIWFLLQYTKGFKGDVAPGQTDALAGPKISGTLTDHNLLCVCDPTFPPSTGLLTYRGNEMVNTAAIVGDYIPFYKAPVHSQGFRKDTALLTEYAVHVVNTDMLGTINVTYL